MSSRLTAEGLCLDEYSANDAYAAVHFKRAVGELPEMESAYFSAVVRRHAPDAAITYLDDDQFQAQNIQHSADTEGLDNATRIIDGKQVFGYVLLPYCFALIELPS